MVERTRDYLVATSLPDGKPIAASDVRDLLDSISHLESGAGAPSSTPDKSGDGYWDTTNKVFYLAIGTATSADWQPVTGLAEVNSQTGTTYTLALTDIGGIVTMNNASANTLTIPTNASVAFPVDTLIIVIQKGAGVTTITGDTGVTLNGVSAGSGAVAAQYSAVSLLKDATDTWVAFGNIGTVA